MVKSKVAIFYFIVFNYLYCIGQQHHMTSHFNLFYGEQSIEMGDSTFTTHDHKMEISELKFYISNLQLSQKGNVVYREHSSHHLIDAAQKPTQEITLSLDSTMSFDQLQFDLGIDSLTNVSGALGGDLDPTKGMYWSWQSGYINFKLEGVANLTSNSNKEFQFHLGGYLSPFLCLQHVVFPISNDQEVITIDFDIKKYLDQIDLMRTNHIMSPNSEAVLLSKILPLCFNINRK